MAILYTHSLGYLTTLFYPYLHMASKIGDLLVRGNWIELTTSANEPADMDILPRPTSTEKDRLVFNKIITTKGHPLHDMLPQLAD